MVGYAGRATGSSASIDASDMDKVVFMTLTVEGANAEALTARVVSRKAVFIVIIYCA
jgi:hypothetical protein